MRELQILIAYLRDEYATVDLTAVVPNIQHKIDELVEQNKETLETLHLTSDFLIRSAKAIQTLVTALARLHGRHAANTADVSMAFDLLEEKMRFLSMIEPAFDYVEDWEHSPSAVEQRQRRIIEHFAGRTVALATVGGMFDNVSPKTITRDLKAVVFA